ncbi:MAG: peptide MFS transporter [Bacteroidia bacterium]|jgi:POT family proton-dependent oligopeptide transporter|nr:peptide MFS transporter [Bacteroidia bacterium]
MSQIKQGHPKGLYVLFVTEMWERFSYYGMRAIFVLFMSKALLFDKAIGSEIYGSYTGLVYLTPLLGGYMADRYWGNRKSIIIGGILMAIGQFFMFIAGSLYQESFAPMIMFVGLGFLIFGNGFFKPNISTMVGQLYQPGDQRVDSAFTIFYMGINLGAFVAPLLCGYLGDTGNPADFKWGFLAACLGMVLSVILFVTLKNKYIVTPEGVQIGDKPNVSRMESSTNTNESGEINTTQIIVWLSVFAILFSLFKFVFSLDLIGAFIFSLTIVAPGFIISDKSLSKQEKDKIWVIYIAAFFVIFFWAAFEQAGASLTYFAEEQTNRTLFGEIVPASYFQSINAVAIVIFAPVFVWIWGGLSRSNREPASPFKQALGLFLLAIGYLVIAFGVKGIDPSTKVSMGWLIGLYTIHTFGELCLSPIGLSMVNKLSPARLASLLMGVWFLSTASANKFAGTLSSLYPEEVKIEKSISNETDIKNINQLAAFTIDTSVWSADPKGSSSFALATLNTVKLNDGRDSIIGIDVGTNQATVSNFHLKLIKMANDTFDRAVLIDGGKKLVTQEVVEKVVDKVQVSTTKIQVWNLAPEKPTFLGVQINNLFDFFMVFVLMAGASSVILFFLSRKLLQMMHGIN